MTAGLAVLVYGIVSTDVHPWGSARTLVTLAVGLALLAAFFVTEARFAKDPLIPLSIFRRRSLSVANGIAVTIGAGLFGTYFFLSLFLQNVNGYSPLRTGLAFLPAGLSTLIGALIGSRLVQVLGARRQLIARSGPGRRRAALAVDGGRRRRLSAPRPRPGDPGRPGHRHVVRPHDSGGYRRRPRARGGARFRVDQHHPADRRGPRVWPSWPHWPPASPPATGSAGRRCTAAFTSGYRTAFAIAGCGLIVGAGLATLAAPALFTGRVVGNGPAPNRPRDGPGRWRPSRRRQDDRSSWRLTNGPEAVQGMRTIFPRV